MRTGPMLAVAQDEPFSDPDWYFEPKWDGIRCQASWDGERLSLRSRTGREMSREHPGFAKPCDEPVVLDGEMVALDDEGRPSFQLLQGRLNLGGARVSEAAGRAPVVMFVFDLLDQGAEDLRPLPFSVRRRRLEAVDLSPPWHLSEGVVAEGEALWEAVLDQGLEGIVAKRMDSPYRPGVRSPEWRKILAYRTVRAVVGGFTPGEGSRASTFGSLLLGLWDGDGLAWIGSVGTGFDDRSLRLIRDSLDKMTTERAPFNDDLDLPGARWVSPSLVAHVRFKEWTADRRLRHPSFRGFGSEDPSTMTVATEGRD